MGGDRRTRSVGFASRDPLAQMLRFWSPTLSDGAGLMRFVTNR